jgi:hypothetical protein
VLEPLQTEEEVDEVDVEGVVSECKASAEPIAALVPIRSKAEFEGRFFNFAESE